MKPDSFSKKHHWVQSVRKHLICTCCLVLLCLPNCIKNNDIPNPVRGNFDLLFSVIDTLEFTSTKDHPIISPAQGIAITKNKVLIPDGLGNQIIIYDRTLDSMYTFGRRGQGPGEFVHPAQIIVSPSGKSIYVVDSGNYRIQIFDSTFKVEMTISFSENMQQVYIQNQNDGLHYWIVGPIETEQQLFLLTEYNLTSNSVNRYLPSIREKIKFYSWVSEIDNAGNIFVANIIIPEISVFNSKTQNMRKILLSGSFEPTDAFNESYQNRRELQKQLQEFNKNPSQIMSIKVHQNLIYVTVAGKHENKMTLLLDIYDKNGNLSYFEIIPPGLLLYSDEENFYFIETKEEREFTKIIVYIAVLKNIINLK